MYLGGSFSLLQGHHGDLHWLGLMCGVETKVCRQYFVEADLYRWACEYIAVFISLFQSFSHVIIALLMNKSQ
jgi:hypothetical protein